VITLVHDVARRIRRTPDFAQRALEAIAGAGFTIPLVLTRPDKPKAEASR